MKTVDALCREVKGLRPLSKDENLFLGAVLLRVGTDTDHMKTWLYDERKVEVVVHKWLGHEILRFSVQAHVSEADLVKLVQVVKEYYSIHHTEAAKL